MDNNRHVLANFRSNLRIRNSQTRRRMDERRGEEMEKEVIQPYYEDDYQSLDEMSTIDLLEMKDAALEELNEREHIIHRINQILDSRIEGERPKIKEVKVKK